jgi:outer membrane protein
MKKYLILGISAVALIFVAANNITNDTKKLGYVNTMDVFQLMPEAGKADTILAKYAEELEKELEDMYGEYEKKVKDYQSKQGDRSATLNQSKQEEILQLQQRIQKTEQAFQQELVEKQRKLLAPIEEKIDKAVQDVAKENGISYVFDTSKGAILYADEKDDITPLVTKKLGLKTQPKK